MKDVQCISAANEIVTSANESTKERIMKHTKPRPPFLSLLVTSEFAVTAVERPSFTCYSHLLLEQIFYFLNLILSHWLAA